MNKKILWYALAGFTMSLSLFPITVLAIDGPTSEGSMTIPWESSIKPGTMPDEVAKEAAWVKEAALTEMEKKEVERKRAECLKSNPGQTSYCECVANGGVKLNTDVPFVGRCINKTDTSNAFPALIGGISKIVVTAILIVSFMFVIIGGVQRASGDAKGGKDKITKVAIGLAILGASGAILALINPNFFK